MYESFILKTVPRVLSQIDRDKDSPTYGCCDRNHWHLKIRDFASAILQQSGLALALLYLNDFEGNEWYQNSYVREWAIATVYYWKKIQLRDGSFNEYYPNEHGFPPTAFSLYAMCEVYKRLEMRDEAIVEAFRKTARYLTEHIEPKAYNQELASITALYSVYSLTGEAWIHDGMKAKLDRILSLQSGEGWFSEYEGADIGYLSVSLDMLSEYYWMSGDETVREPLDRVISFIQYFIHPDGTIGGEYASRNTTYFLPNGVETMLQKGNACAGRIKRGILQGSASPLYYMDAVDDRYCSHYLLHSFLRALEKEKNPAPEPEGDLPCRQDGVEAFFPEAGLYLFGDGRDYAIVGGKKGGVIKLYRDGKPVWVDCGYRVVYPKAKIAATNWQDDTWQVAQRPNEIKIKGQFTLVGMKRPTPILHMGLRVVSFLVGNRIIGTLKKKIILVNKHVEIGFERNIRFKDGEVIVRDTIKSPNPVTVRAADNFSLRHVASGKFYASSDLAAHGRDVYEGVREIVICQVFQRDGTLKRWIENKG